MTEKDLDFPLFVAMIEDFILAGLVRRTSQPWTTESKILDWDFQFTCRCGDFARRTPSFSPLETSDLYVWREKASNVCDLIHAEYRKQLKP